MEALSELGPEKLALALSPSRSADEIVKLTQELPSDDAAAIIDYLPEELAAAVLELMQKRPAGADVGELLEYPEQTAGRIMNPKVFALSEDMTASERPSPRCRRRATSRWCSISTSSTHVVISSASCRCAGCCSCRPTTPLKRIMTTDIISVRADMDQEEVARQVASYNLLAIPVVDEENKLVGVITVDDVIDVIKDEATEDVYRLAGVPSDDRVFTPPSDSLRKRLPWLIVNLATAFLAASVVALFEASDRRTCPCWPFDAGRRRHGRQRRDADPHRDRPRHRARRADVEQHAQGAVEGSGRRHRQRRRLRSDRRRRRVAVKATP